MIHILKTPTAYTLITLFISSCNQENIEQEVKSNTPVEIKSTVENTQRAITYKIIETTVSSESTESTARPVMANTVILKKAKPAGKAMKDLIDNLSDEDLANVPRLELDTKNDESNPLTQPTRQTKKAKKAQ